MIFLMAVIPYLPIQNIDQAIMDLLRKFLPGQAAVMFEGVVREVTGNRSGGLPSIGFVLALWSASAGMVAIMRQLNITYRVKEARPFIKAPLVAIGLTRLLGLLGWALCPRSF
jgi:membrane protein